jgi:hypothetical protein
MKKSILTIILLTLFNSLSRSKNTDNIEWIILKSKTEFKNIFFEDNIFQDSISKNEALKAIEIIKINFNQIKNELKMNNSSNISNYKFQLIIGKNIKNEKIIFVNGFTKNIPKWVQKDWKTKIIQLKCVENNLISFKINLNSKSIYHILNTVCK